MEDSERLQQLTTDGIRIMSLDIAPKKVDQLVSFLEVLSKWNRTYNLTAIRKPAEMVTHHLLDSLAVLPYLNGTDCWDIGSGCGVPGFPLAIARPDMLFHLVERIQKKTRFLTQAVIELELKNVQVHAQSVEQITANQPADCIISRAFASLHDFVCNTAHLGNENTRWLAMKGRPSEQELAALPEHFYIEATHPIEIPGLDAQRHLVIARKRSIEV